MLNAFDYKKMWEGFKKKYADEYIMFEGRDLVEQAMDEFEEDYIKKNKNKLGYHKKMCIDYNVEPIKIQCLICDEEFEIENNYSGVIVCPKCGAWTEDLISWFSC